jgi:hypothetical protein
MHNSSKAIYGTSQSRFFCEFSDLEFYEINDEEIEKIIKKLKTQTISNDAISKNLLKQALDNFIEGRSGFKSFSELLDEKEINDINQRIALENLFREIAPSQYYQDVVKLRIQRQQKVSKRSISLVDLIDHVNEIWNQHKPDSIKKSDLVNSLIDLFKETRSNILSSSHDKNQKIDFEDLRILPKVLQESLIEQLVSYQLENDIGENIEEDEKAMSRLHKFDEETFEESIELQKKVDEEKLFIKKTLQEKLFLDHLIYSPLDEESKYQLQKYFDELDHDLKFKILSRIWKKNPEILLHQEHFKKSLLEALKNDDHHNLADIVFSKLAKFNTNLKFNDFKQAIDAFCEDKIISPADSYVENIVKFHLIIIIRIHSQETHVTHQNRLIGFEFAKYTLQSFSEKFLSNQSSPLISFSTFKNLVEAIERNSSQLTSDQFKELCDIYKIINNSDEVNQYALSRSSQTASIPSRALESSQKHPELSEKTIDFIRRQVQKDILESKIFHSLTQEDLQNDLSYKLFQKLSLTDHQLPSLEQFVTELKTDLASKDNIQFTDLKKILFYSDRLIKRLTTNTEQASNAIRNLISFYSMTRSTKLDQKERRLVDDLLINYDPNSLNSSNPVNIDQETLGSYGKFNYFFYQTLSPDDFVIKLSKSFLSQDEINVLAKQFILDHGLRFVDEFENFVSRISDLVCGSQNQLSKILYKQKLIESVSRNPDLSSQVLDDNSPLGDQLKNNIKSQKTDVFLGKSHQKHLAEQALDKILKDEISKFSAKGETYVSQDLYKFIDTIKNFLDTYIADPQDRYLALQYIAQESRFCSKQLQKFAFNLVIKDSYEILKSQEIYLEDIPARISDPKTRFLFGIKTIINKDYSHPKATLNLLEDINYVFELDPSVKADEKKLFLNILFDHKTNENKYFSRSVLKNFKINLLSQLEMQQHPKPNLMEMEVRINQQPGIEEDVRTDCCFELRSAMSKFGSAIYQRVADAYGLLSAPQKLTPNQASKLKIIEFVNQMKDKSSFEEVLSAIAPQINRSGFNFQEKVDLVVKSVLDYQIDKPANNNITRNRILTGLKFCSINLDSDHKLNTLKTILELNGVNADVSKSNLVLHDIKNLSHENLLNNVYSNNLGHTSLTQSSPRARADLVFSQNLTAEGGVHTPTGHPDTKRFTSPSTITRQPSLRIPSKSRIERAEISHERNLTRYGTGLA